MKPLKYIDKNMKLKYNNEIQPHGVVDNIRKYSFFLLLGVSKPLTTAE